MRAQLAADFGTVQVTVDEGSVRRVDLSPQEGEDAVPEAFPAEIAASFRAYLDGDTDRPAVPVGEVDVTSFQRRVLEALADVEPAHPVTYGELAEKIGKPNAARAVGQALRSNPVPLVWPCHRVVSADGIGGFGGAREADDEDKIAIKRWLLAHERRATSACRVGKR